MSSNENSITSKSHTINGECEDLACCSISSSNDICNCGGGGGGGGGEGDLANGCDENDFFAQIEHDIEVSREASRRRLDAHYGQLLDDVRTHQATMRATLLNSASSFGYQQIVERTKDLVAHTLSNSTSSHHMQIGLAAPAIETSSDDGQSVNFYKRIFTG